MRNPFKRQPRPIEKPTLKQRAAALKATAARLIRKPKNGPNADTDLCALAGPWEAACRLYDRRIEEQSALERAAMLHPSYPGERPEGSGPDWQDFHQRWLEHRERSGLVAGEEASGEACIALGEIEDQIAALPARTLAGLQIKARVAERNSSIDVEWPQGLGDGLVADLLSLTGSLPAVPVAPPAAPSVGKPDPIFALIEASSADEEVDWHSPPPGFMAFPAIEPTHFFNIRYGIVAELERLRDIARAEYARREPHFRDSRFAEEEIETRLSALRDELRLSALDAAITGTRATSAGASAAGPDPILAAIEASRTTHAAVEAWSDAAETRTGPLSESDAEEEKRLCDAQWKARESVVNTVPTTAAGRLALLEWLRWQLENYSLLDGSPPDQHSHFWEFSYKALKAALAWDGPAVVSNHETNADAELIALGQRFDALHALWREADKAEEEPAVRRDEALSAAQERGGPTVEEICAAWALPGVTEANERTEKAYAALEPVVREIAAAPTGSVQGLAIKARTLISALWPRGNYEQDMALGEAEDWAEQVARQLIEACCSAAGVDWRGQIQGAAPTISGTYKDDAELIALGRAFDAAAARTQEADDAHEADRLNKQKRQAADETAGAAYVLAEQIAPLPVHTLAGMHVKLRLAAFYWTCLPREPHEDEDDHTGEIAIRSLYRSTPGIVLGVGPFGVRIVPEADMTTTAATEA